MTAEATPRTVPPFPWIVTTSVVAGALVMTIEVLGSRVIGPFFGASLFVWTSIIGVTLLALSVGYAFGGRMADATGGSADRLYFLLALAGVATLLIPLLRGPVLRGCVGLGIRSGAFVSSLVLFGPPLVLLGMVSPFVVRLAARQMDSVGWTVGFFSALSTAGSLAGTVITGFWLIPAVGVSKIFLGVGLGCLALAAGWFGVFRKKAIAVLLLSPALLVLRGEPRVDKVLDNGTRVQLLERRESLYGELKVVEYSEGSVRDRELLIDGLVQGGVDPGTGESFYEYSYFLSRLPLAKNPAAKSALAIGLGAGVVPTWLESKGIRCDVLDIDAEVVALAREYFGFRSSGQVVVEDARAGLARMPGPWDIVLLDVFGGDTTPGHLLSREALALVKPRLAPGGVLAANLITQAGSGDDFVLGSIVATLGTVFDVVEIHPNGEIPAGGGVTNLTVIAYDGPRREVDRERLLAEPVHPFAKAGVEALIGIEWTLPPGTPSVLITDDYNPLDFHDRATREEVRRRILEGTDPDVLL